MNMTTDSSHNKLYCSFCGKEHAEVQKLIAGPTVFICNECVDLCQDIVSGRPHEKAIRISLMQRNEDVKAAAMLAKPSVRYRSDEDLPAELREAADARPALFGGYVLLCRHDWDRLISLAFRSRLDVRTVR